MRILAIGEHGIDELAELRARLDCYGLGDRLEGACVLFEGDPKPDSSVGTCFDFSHESEQEREWSRRYGKVKHWVRGNLGSDAFLGFDMSQLEEVMSDPARVSELAKALRGQSGPEANVTFNGTVPDFLPMAAKDWLRDHPNLGPIHDHRGLQPLFGVRPSELWRHRRGRKWIFPEKWPQIDYVLGSMGDRNVSDVFVRVLAESHGHHVGMLAPIWPMDTDGQASENSSINFLKARARKALDRMFAGPVTFGELDLEVRSPRVRPADFLEALIWIGEPPVTRVGIARAAIDAPRRGFRNPRLTATLEPGTGIEVGQRDILVTVNTWSSEANGELIPKLVMGQPLIDSLGKRKWGVKAVLPTGTIDLPLDAAIPSEFENLLAVVAVTPRRSP